MRQVHKKTFKIARIIKQKINCSKIDMKSS